MAIATSVEIRPNPYAAMAAGHRPTMQGDVASAMDFMAKPYRDDPFCLVVPSSLLLVVLCMLCISTLLLQC